MKNKKQFSKIAKDEKNNDISFDFIFKYKKESDHCFKTHCTYEKIETHNKLNIGDKLINKQIKGYPIMEIIILGESYYIDDDYNSIDNDPFDNFEDYEKIYVYNVEVNYYIKM